MSDRPSPANGKHDTFWGTTHACAACGRCLCYGCHPCGPCVDQQDRGAFVPQQPESTSASSKAGAA